MLVISDTTPLITLMKIGHLDILKQLFTTIAIPEAVYYELIGNADYPQEAEIISTCDFIQIIAIPDRESVKRFQRITGLDLGESEAIIVSDLRNADLLLMDELKGRAVAKNMEIKVIGTLGILQKANEEGLLSATEVEQSMDTMINNKRYISKELYNFVLGNLH